MYFAVILVCKTKLCIPASWLRNINVVDCFNNLQKRSVKKVIFFSFDESKAPDFLLPIINDFDDKNDACYHAYVLKAFENKDECIEYLNKRRAITPVHYSQRAVVPAKENALHDEITRQIAIDQKSLEKKEINSMRQAILQNRGATSIDLTEDDIEDIQNSLNEPITIDEEYSIMMSESQRVGQLESLKADCLSGSMPFQELSVGK